MDAHLTVGYDGSPESRQALAWAADEAERRGVGVLAVACYKLPMVAGPWVPYVPYDDATVRAATGEDLRKAVDHVRKRHPTVSYEERLAYGPPRTKLVEEAEGSDLLVVGANGVGATASWLLGSVAYASACASPCPVAIVPRGADRPTQNRIVVGADGSEPSDAALVWAVDEADRRGAELVVVHAWDYPYGTELSSEQVHDLMKVDAAFVLDRAVGLCVDRGRSPVRGELVRRGPATAILEQSTDADLVVVGSRGRGGFRSLLFGSVARAVAQHSCRPVVIVRRTATDPGARPHPGASGQGWAGCGDLWP